MVAPAWVMVDGKFFGQHYAVYGSINPTIIAPEVPANHNERRSLWSASAINSNLAINFELNWAERNEWGALTFLISRQNE